MLDIKHELPVRGCMWYPTVKITKTNLSNFIYTILFHAIPAILFDLFLRVTNNKLRLLPIYRQVVQFSGLLTLFTSREWNFSNKNMLSIFDR